MSNLKFGSLNCRGLFSDKIKRTDIFSKCKIEYDNTFLLDTHSTHSIENEWRCEWGSEAIFNSCSSNSRGIAILFKQSFKYTIHNSFKDSNGNYIILDITIQDQRMTISAVYGPNDDKPTTFFNTLFQHVESFGNTSIVMAGDWNVPLNYKADTYNYKHNNNIKSNKAIIENMKTLDLRGAFDKFCNSYYISETRNINRYKVYIF